ncbi:endonuclease I family protein [Streptomyces sp. NPDC091377]|uniref:endonuclease I family protein n=1 Tax=Streptomyces sp. NPDC091377 TaxID=3365995 RepID=UPI003802FBFD
MPVTHPRHRRPVALAASAVLLALTLPALTTTPATATPPAPRPASATADATTPAPAADYYADATGKTGPALKSALHTIISDQTKLSYSAVWEALKVTDQDPRNSGNVVLLYSGLSRSKTLNGGNSGNWNREHVWAQSHGGFGTSAGPGTDLHHLRPEDVQLNSVRGNKDFDNGGSPVTNGGGSLTDSDSFEPRDAVKGDVARMILYMAVRYEGGDSWPDLEPNNSVSNGSVPYHGRLSVLKQWNDEDPPDAGEQRRNELIHSDYQGNRNPFIDHPEWVEAIW